MASLDWRSVLKELRVQNWTLSKNNNGHWKAVPPDPSLPLVTFSESGDPRAIKNTLRDLRDSGFQWNEREPRSVRTPASFPVSVPDVDDLPPMTLPEREPPTLDSAFRRLKEAKDDYDLASMHEGELSEKMVDLRAQLARAAEERSAACQALVSAKADFDRFFNVESLVRDAAE